MPHLNLLMEAAIFCLICDWMALYSRLLFLLQSCEPSDSNFWRLPFCFDLTLEFHWYNHSKVLALFSFHALWASVNCLTVTVVFVCVCGVFFFPHHVHFCVFKLANKKLDYSEWPELFLVGPSLLPELMNHLLFLCC